MGTILQGRQLYCVRISKDKSSFSFLLRPSCRFSYMVDAADHDKMDASKSELQSLLEKPQLAGIPVLVLGNKKDLPNSLNEKDLIERM